MTLIDLMTHAAQLGASDVHFTPGNKPTMRRNGTLLAIHDQEVSPEDVSMLVKTVLKEDHIQRLMDVGHVDVSYRVVHKHRFRINVYRYSFTFGFACRVISDQIPTVEALELPDSFKSISDYPAGLVLFTGPTGCGKSTSIATVINEINQRKNKHILTLEDPIEYVHISQKSIVTQREVGRDCRDFSEALRAGLRQDPDVILVGEMRDLETISTAVTAAETGHLVLATLHTRNAAQTIERIIDVFPTRQQQQIRVQLANSLVAVFSQSLVPRSEDSSRIAVVESMVVTPAIRSLIRENKVHQLQTFIQTGHKIGMQTFDDNLRKLYYEGKINKEVVFDFAHDKELMVRMMT